MVSWRIEGNFPFDIAFDDKSTLSRLDATIYCCKTRKGYRLGTGEGGGNAKRPKLGSVLVPYAPTKKQPNLAGQKILDRFCELDHNGLNIF
jgi:hypothetical protein